MQPMSATLRPACFLPGFEVAELADHFVFGALAYNAGVENDHVGIVQPVGGTIADLLQFGGHVVGVGYVHLAADGPDVVLARPASAGRWQFRR